MISESLLSFPPLTEGILLKRYKRFLADIELDSGEIVTAHCANTGPMTGVLHIGGRVRVRYAPSPSRKLDWSWEQAQSFDSSGLPCWVGVNTSLPNKLARLVIEAGYLENSLGEIAELRQEVVYGISRKSRIDLLAIPDKDSEDSRNIYIEVKNTTWIDGDMGIFPDTVTVRGQKHLKELMAILPSSRAVLFPCISRSDVKTFAPGDHADEEYGKLFRQALSEGVEVLPCCFGFHRDHITWEGERPFVTRQQG